MSDPYSTLPGGHDATNPSAAGRAGAVIPVGIAADQIAQALEEWRADLRAWAELTGRPLPMPADQIIALELRGHVVDLYTGEATKPQDPPVIWEVPA